MLFSSVTFLYYFLPIVLVLYFISPKRIKNSVILLSSLVFYGWGEPRYVFLMIATVLAGYVFGILIERFKDKSLSKLFMIFSAIISLSGLLFFKYADFFITNFNAVTGLSIPLLKVVLPIGISFYTFQILSYTVDVYRGDVPAQKNFIDLATYISLFPQLIAGPIVRYSDIATQLSERKHTFEKAYSGVSRFIIGLGKKILIANVLGELGESFLSSTDLSVLYYWLYAVSFMLQIYFDFSGYSDMAIGLGKILGFDFMENFNYPFISSSITEFWRRWHISLGSWFRDYVYIPLGGNRCTRPRMLFNIFVVWFLTGFWHGAEWNFIIWGLYFGILLTLEKFFFIDALKKHKVLGHIYTLFFVAVSFMIFASGGFSQIFSYVGSMFGSSDIALVSTEAVYQLKNYGIILIFASIGATPILKNTFNKFYANKRYTGALEVLKTIYLIFILILVSAYLADGSFNPFLYFRF